MLTETIPAGTHERPSEQGSVRGGKNWDDGPCGPPLRKAPTLKLMRSTA